MRSTMMDTTLSMRDKTGPALVEICVRPGGREWMGCGPQCCGALEGGAAPGYRNWEVGSRESRGICQVGLTFVITNNLEVNATWKARH